MAINTVDYIALSDLAYIDLHGHESKTIATLIEDNVVNRNRDLTKPELSALQDPSNPLRSFRNVLV